MKNKKNISEERLEELLKNYCKREPKYSFKFRTEEKVMKRKPNFRYAAATLCVAVMLFGGFIALQYTAFSGTDKNSSVVSDNAAPGFIVTAYAAESDSGKADGTKLKSVDTKINPKFPLVEKTYDNFEFDSQGKSISEDNPLEECEETKIVENSCLLSFDYIGLEVTDKDIVSYDIRTDNGEFNYVDSEKMEKYKGKGNTDSSIIDKYFQKGSEINGIPVDANNPNKSIVNWYPAPYKLFNEINKTTGSDFNIDDYYNKFDIMSKMSPEIDERLKTAEDFTNYFGAVINITVHYKDGTSENGIIKIMLDEYGFATASITKA